MPSPIETVSRLRHQFFTPRISRQPLRLQDNDDAESQPSTSNARGNEPQLEPEVQAILDDDYEDISDEGNDVDIRQNVVDKKRVVNRSPRRKKSTDDSEFSFVSKSSAIFDFQMFAGMKLAKEAEPVLMEAITKFNDLSLRYKFHHIFSFPGFISSLPSALLSFVYFDQRMGAPHTVCWSKSNF